ncbi:MAG TPA: histidine kinase [Ktedonobacterales bacterium]
MSRLTGRFRGLRWRLMLSFFVAAWAAMMTLEAMFVVVPGIIAMNTPQHPAILSQDLARLAPQAAPSLTLTPPDQARLTATLANFKQPMYISEGLTENYRGTATIIPGGNASLYVIGLDGATLAALPARDRTYSDLEHIETTSEARAVVALALHGGASSGTLVRNTSGGLTVAAAPILGADGVPRGALLLGVDLTALARPVYLSSFLGLLPSAVLFGVIASIFGVVFGLLTARGLTQRMSRLTMAADAWSHGDFTVSAHDAQTDELGQLAHDLNRMAEQLQNLLQDRQQLAVVEERNRLARDLHDSVKQQMFALTMLLGSAQLEVEEHREAHRILADAERIASSAQKELSGLIAALRPVALTHAGLSAALRELCASWAIRTGIACDTRIPDDLALSASAEQEFFRAAQEALANIARHSGATRVEMSAERTPEHVTLRIRDNGHGFDVAQTDRQGVGLRSMRERLEGLGGTLRISSSVGGTRIDMEAPTLTRAPDVAPSVGVGSVDAQR